MLKLSPSAMQAPPTGCPSTPPPAQVLESPFAKNGDFSERARASFSKTFLDECARHNWPRRATDCTLLDHTRMKRLPRFATAPPSTITALKGQLEECGLHGDYANALVDKWSKMFSPNAILVFARPEELALNLAISCAIESSGERKHADSQGADNSHHSADGGAGPSAKTGNGATESNEGGGDGDGDGGEGCGGGDDGGRDKEDRDEGRGGRGDGMPGKRTKLRDERPFRNIIRHETARQFLSYTQVGGVITEDGLRHGEPVHCRHPSIEKYTVLGYYSVFHGTTREGIIDLQASGRWDPGMVRRFRDLSNQHGIYFSTLSSYALMHSVFSCGLTEDFRFMDNFQAIVVETFLNLDDEVVGIVQKEHMQSFYDTNRSSVSIDERLSGFLVGGFLEEDRNLAAGSFSQTDGSFLESAFSGLQIAVIGERAMNRTNAETNRVHVVNISPDQFKVLG